MDKILRIGALAAVAIITGIFAFGGPREVVRKISGNNTRQLENQTVSARSALETALADVPVLDPVAERDFGDFRLVTSKADDFQIQRSDGPSKVNGKVDDTLYQGVIYKTSDTFFKVLFGKLSDKSKGQLALDDAFELVVQPMPDGSSNVSLRQTSPSSLDLDTTKIVRWSNLSNDNDIIRVLRDFKTQNN